MATRVAIIEYLSISLDGYIVHCAYLLCSYVYISLLLGEAPCCRRAWITLITLSMLVRVAVALNSHWAVLPSIEMETVTWESGLSDGGSDPPVSLSAQVR
jgi:hypothetical protein